ncbi:MAG TPA: DUF202 domain-containing protein [Rhodanobacter sp.]
MIPRFSDHAANERTYLAWVRTAITVMAFGFLLERFDIFIFYASHVAGKAIPELHVRASEWLGLGLLLFGALVILFATLRFNQNRVAIDSTAIIPHGARRLERVLGAILIVMAVFLVIYVARQVVALN